MNLTRRPDIQMKYLRAMMDDTKIPGKALRVALGLVARVRWGNPSSPIPTHAVADRMGVERQYAADVLILLCHLGYFSQTDRRNKRKMYMATMPES